MAVTSQVTSSAGACHEARAASDRRQREPPAARSPPADARRRGTTLTSNRTTTCTPRPARCTSSSAVAATAAPPADPPPSELPAPHRRRPCRPAGSGKQPRGHQAHRRRRAPPSAADLAGTARGGRCRQGVPARPPARAGHRDAGGRWRPGGDTLPTSRVVTRRRPHQSHRWGADGAPLGKGTGAHRPPRYFSSASHEFFRPARPAIQAEKTPQKGPEPFLRTT